MKPSLSLRRYVFQNWKILSRPFGHQYTLPEPLFIQHVTIRVLRCLQKMLEDVSSTLSNLFKMTGFNHIKKHCHSLCVQLATIARQGEGSADYILFLIVQSPGKNESQQFQQANDKATFNMVSTVQIYYAFVFGNEDFINQIKSY